MADEAVSEATPDAPTGAAASGALAEYLSEFKGGSGDRGGRSRTGLLPGTFQSVQRGWPDAQAEGPLRHEPRGSARACRTGGPTLTRLA